MGQWTEGSRWEARRPLRRRLFSSENKSGAGSCLGGEKERVGRGVNYATRAPRGGHNGQWAMGNGQWAMQSAECRVRSAELALHCADCARAGQKWALHWATFAQCKAHYSHSPTTSSNWHQLAPSNEQQQQEQNAAISEKWRLRPIPSPPCPLFRPLRWNWTLNWTSGSSWNCSRPTLALGLPLGLAGR